MKEKLEKLPFYNQMVLPYHFLQALVAGTKYGFPAKKMRVIGVTGTNGKTTTCFMIWKMLSEAGHKTGLMTTVAWGGVGGEKTLNKQIEHMTTVDAVTLNRRMKKIAEAGAEFLVLEVTSHAMVQFRTLGIPIEIAVMTNVTHDHLDYHKTFDNYVTAKCKLFKKAKYGVANADDKSAEKFLTAVKDGVKYGIDRGEVRAEKVELGVTGVKYKCQDMEIKTQIPGKFNIYNSLAAVCVGKKLGLTGEQIEKGIFALTEVEGRMNEVKAGQNFTVIVDYAHTPDALEKVFESVAGHNGKVISVHGGAGRRDESTREIRGKILGKNSDVVIITEDDSRDENPEKIAEAFKNGAEKAGKKLGKDVFLEMNREKAIKMAVKMAKKGDLVLILGKGHEKTILRHDGAHPFEDLKIVKKAIEEII